MTESALRKELQGYIETIPARKLAALKPLLSELSEKHLIEPANFWERMKAKKRFREMKKNPDCYVTLDSIRKDMRKKS